jgi:CheY-like chemotaxis protein
MTTQDGSAPGSAGRADASPPGQAGILIVDDRQENLTAFEAVISSLGHEIVLAHSGAEALERAFRKTFAVIVMDVRMPILGGFQTAAILRKREAYRVTPIIFTSAYAVSADDIAPSYVAGATDFIETPADSELLKYKVQAFIQLHFRNERIRTRARRFANELEALKLEVARNRQDKPLLDCFRALEETLLRLEVDLSGRGVDERIS